MHWQGGEVRHTFPQWLPLGTETTAGQGTLTTFSLMPLTLEPCVFTGVQKSHLKSQTKLDAYSPALPLFPIPAFPLRYTPGGSR